MNLLFMVAVIAGAPMMVDLHSRGDTVRLRRLVRGFAWFGAAPLAVALLLYSAWGRELWRRYSVQSMRRAHQ